jgi:adenosylcobinamide-phosphate synthase
MSISIQIIAAYIIDLVIGDPKKLPHPVIYIGKAIDILEAVIRRRINKTYFKLAGLLFPILIVGGAYLAVWLLLSVLTMIHPLLSFVVGIWVISTTIATKGLKDAALEISSHLRNGELERARLSLGMIVGRDTANLSEEDVSRGTVETVAENIVDAITSPLFWAFIGGAPLAFAYRAVNTLDSMVGYKNERYEQLGWASAKLDDLANYIPARITAILLIITAWIVGHDGKQSYKIIKRDARKHPSPNSGFPEAAVAGALGIQLGGTNYYQGVVSNRATLGDKKRPIVPSDISITIKYMLIASSLFVGLFSLMFIIN